PPLPRHLAASGKWWLALSGLVVAAWVVVVATKTVAVFDAADTAGLRWIAALRTPWLTRVAEVAGVLATPRALHILWLVNLVALVVLRRWRHLFVWVGVLVVVVEGGRLMTGTLQR